MFNSVVNYFGFRMIEYIDRIRAELSFRLILSHIKMKTDKRPSSGQEDGPVMIRSRGPYSFTFL